MLLPGPQILVYLALGIIMPAERAADYRRPAWHSEASRNPMTPVIGPQY